MLKKYWLLAKQIFSEWSDHEAPRMGAALAFYTILSLSPLLVLVVAIAGLFFDRSGVLQKLTAQVQDLLGTSGAEVVTTTLTSAQKSSSESLAASSLSLVVLLISASGVFGELRSALNKIWGAKPESAGGIWGLLRERFFSFGMVFAVGFLLVSSLVLSAGLAVAASFLGGLVPMPHVIASVIDLAISLFGVAVVFTLTFKYVPATNVGWREARIGGMATAILFTAGKFLIGLYLSKAAVGSAYGAAGSVVVVIVWIYYTAQIVFFGAEFTHVIGSSPAADRNSA